jgi:hypothetical protein
MRCHTGPNKVLQSTKLQAETGWFCAGKIGKLLFGRPFETHPDMELPMPGKSPGKIFIVSDKYAVGFQDEPEILGGEIENREKMFLGERRFAAANPHLSLALLPGDANEFSGDIFRAMELPE